MALQYSAVYVCAVYPGAYTAIGGSLLKSQYDTFQYHCYERLGDSTVQISTFKSSIYSVLRYQFTNPIIFHKSVTYVLSNSIFYILKNYELESEIRIISENDHTVYHK